MTRIAAPNRLPTAAEVNLAALGVLTFALVAHLWPEWTHDPDLSHGFLMPVVAVVLLGMSRADRGSGTLNQPAALALTLGFGACAVAGLFTAGLFAVTLDWSSPVVDFTLACSYALLGCGALAAFACRGEAWIPFNWMSIAAMLLWPLCSPFPPGTYSRLTQALQLWVSTNVLRTLDLLGIAAHQQGNVIELAHGSVGVEEACSGVRSLISCVFVGALLSAALCRRPVARILVVVLSVPLALAMNFLRSLLLTLLVNRGIRVEGPVHDATGYAVLVVTALILLAIAIALDFGAAKADRTKSTEAEADRGWSSRVQWALLGVVAVVGAVLVFFVAHTSESAAVGPAPDLTAMLPAPTPGWRADPSRDLYRFAGTLRTNHLAQTAYYRTDASGTEQVTIYVAYWSPGQASAGLVATHTPDACWPGAGWVARNIADTRSVLRIGGRDLPEAQHRLFVDQGYPQEVWFWQVYDRKVVDIGNPRSVPALIRLALDYGFRKGGEQAFIRISSNRPWTEVSREPFVSEFFGRARSLGLYCNGDASTVIAGRT